MERGHILFKMFGKFCPQGTILFNENDPGEEMYYIQSGTMRTGCSGKEEPLDLGPGDILGQEALLERAARTCMAEATEDTRLLVIDGRNIESVIRNGPELATTLMGELMRKLDAAWSGLRNWQTRYAIGKLETLLGGSAGGGRLSVEDLSAELEIDEEGVRRALEQLTDAGALARDGDGFHLVDLEVIHKAAGGGSDD
jgi:CRP-like cAMP-binding protein